MASLAEELKLLSLPAPSKINLDNFENDLTSARIISKDDIYEDESESNALNKSNLRKKAAILLADEDKRYAGEAISRKDLLKLRGDVSEDEGLSQDDDASGSDSDYGKQQDLEDMLDENYEFSESGSDESGSEDSERNEGREKEGDKVEEQEGWDEVEAQDEQEREEEWDENEIEENSEMDESEVEGHEGWEEDEKEEGGEYDEEGMQKFSRSDVDEVQKGKAVVHQIALWDSLLENRIRLQKMLVEVNKLPQHDVFDDIKERGGGQIKDPLNNTQQLLTSLVHNLLILQQTLYERNSDTAGILKKESESKTCDSDEDIPSDDEDNEAGDNEAEDNEAGDNEAEDNEAGDNEGGNEGDNEGGNKGDNEVNGGRKDDDDGEDSLKLPRKRKQSMHLDEYSEHIAKRHAAFEHFRDTTIKKWNDKTRLASGKVSSKSFNSFDRSTLNQIKQILSDRERLIKRTQLKRSSYRVLGKTEVNENNNSMEQRDVHLKDYDAEIFDDDDFYHQLLREFIERKSNVDPNDPIAMGRQWLEIQRLRNKVKRKVDTKASKGRRLRYDVHSKLVSFMAPQNRGTMEDSSRNELFSSLFGKRQPQETADISLFR